MMNFNTIIKDNFIYSYEEDEDGEKRWYLNGKFHREDGPAIEWTNGRKSWYLNGKRHREDGPAFEWADGTKLWYLNGKLHREDGPAVEYADGSKFWYLNGKHLTEDEWLKLVPQDFCYMRARLEKMLGDF